MAPTLAALYATPYLFHYGSRLVASPRGSRDARSNPSRTRAARRNPACHSFRTREPSDEGHRLRNAGGARGRPRGRRQLSSGSRAESERTETTPPPRPLARFIAG